MKEKLLRSAGRLIPPEKKIAEEFSRICDELVAKGNVTLSQRDDLEKLIGKNNLPMAEDNNRNFARFMNALFMEYSPEVFVETVLWVFNAYRSHGFNPTYWAANLNIWLKNLENDISREAYAQIYPFYNWLIVNIPLFTKLTDRNE
ncbi:hypothetical protein [Desulfobacter latus]|uniref:Uncharacterized protein n=1 Tax=Desulfobacter latus TaxID=2292 RepID=A0A850SWG2_9BACT|nr:hypothetical protein [Desulfobacter latus]NWH04450.1 hypothetical protein [Desulfobacter latus]